MIGKIVGVDLNHGLTIETTLDPKVQPFLHDHQIDSTPVLPGVMGIEAFAEAAACLLPEWHVEAVEEVNFLAPFKFYRGEQRALRIEVRVHPRGERLIADCRLIGHRTLPNQAEPQPTTHFTARVRLAKQPVIAAAARAFIAPTGSAVDAADIYRLYFHGPAYQVIEKAWWDGKRVVGLFAKELPPNHHPSDRSTIMQPRLIELCFQTAGVWEMGLQGRMGLPQHIGEVCLLRTANLADARLYGVVTPDATRGTFDAEVMDAKGNCYLRLTGYQTVALPNAVDGERLKHLQAVISGEAVLAA
jgi:hypothetical protein